MKQPTEHPLAAALAAGSSSIEELALLVARDEYPRLSVSEMQAKLDDMAAPLVERGLSFRPPLEQVEALAGRIYGELGFKGNTVDYYDPRNSYLPDVLERRVGIPLTLAIVLIAVGRRAGITVDGIGFPGHFLVRIGGDSGVLIDPFFEGRVVSKSALFRLAEQSMGQGAKVTPEHLHVVSARSMVVRMLVNLKHAHERHRDHARALVVSDRLVDLTSSPAFRRDRGLHALALGAKFAAIEDLEAYLGQAGTAPDELTVRHALARAKSGPHASLC